MKLGGNLSAFLRPYIADNPKGGGVDDATKRSLKNAIAKQRKIRMNESPRIALLCELPKGASLKEKVNRTTSETIKNMDDSSPSVILTVGQLRQIIREEIRTAMGQTGHQDRLLDAGEASKILSVSPDWLYRHGSRLPFTRKLAPRVLRFSYQGIQKYLSTRKNT